MNEFWESMVTILSGIIGVAMVAVIVSRNAQSPAVIQSAGSAFSNALDVAVSPVTGNTSPPNLSYPGGSGLQLPNYGFGFGAG